MYLFKLLLILKKIKMSDVTTKVKTIVDKLGVDDSEVTPTASFTDDLRMQTL